MPPIKIFLLLERGYFWHYMLLVAEQNYEVVGISEKKKEERVKREEKKRELTQITLRPPITKN